MVHHGKYIQNLLSDIVCYQQIYDNPLILKWKSVKIKDEKFSVKGADSA